MSKKNLIFALLIFLTLGLYYFVSPTEEDSDNVIVDITEAPIYQSKSMMTRVYDPTGIQIYQVIAYQISYNADDGNTHFQKPDVMIYNASGAPSWHISADKARLTKKRMIDLNGDVSLVNLTPNSQLERITTHSAKVNLATQTVTSPDKVTLHGPNFYSTGYKLEGNLRQKTANLLENVKTFYFSLLQ